MTRPVASIVRSAGAGEPSVLPDGQVGLSHGAAGIHRDHQPAADHQPIPVGHSPPPTRAPPLVPRAFYATPRRRAESPPIPSGTIEHHVTRGRDAAPGAEEG
jgi:hypothetical protein